MTKNYYQILDIPEFCSAEEIKTAYRKLARKWHPDVAGNTADVISRFKEINEAYEVLSDRAKKADYDTARRFYNYTSSESNTKKTSKQQKNTTTNPNSFNDESIKKETKKGFSFSWEDFVAKKYRDAQYRKNQKETEPKRGADICTDVEISVFEAVSGTTKVINMLQTQICPKCHGRKFVNGSLCADCKGKGEVSNYKKFSVKIPAGIKNNSKIRLAGEGEKGINGGKNGDMYLTVHIQEPKSYRTDGLNILKTIEISPFEAVLGADVRVSTLNGNVSLKINPNTHNGQKIRLSECGITSGKSVGDMIITVEIQIPKNLSDEEVELYKRLKDISSSSVREF